MRWNWQLPDWPEFRFDADQIRASVEQFLKGPGVVVGALHHLDPNERDGLTIELISQEIVNSSAIEGEILDRASVQSSLARHLGSAADQRRTSAAEAGATGIALIRRARSAERVATSAFSLRAGRFRQLFVIETREGRQAHWARCRPVHFALNPA